MPIYCWINPATNLRYWTALAHDPNVPAGYVLTSGSDGAPDAALQNYQAGVNNQGAGQVGGVYTDGDPQQRIDQPHWPNGILGTNPGNKTTAQ